MALMSFLHQKPYFAIQINHPTPLLQIYSPHLQLLLVLSMPQQATDSMFQEAVYSIKNA